MNDGRSRVFIQIDNVFIEIFHDKFIGIGWHPCMNETIACDVNTQRKKGRMAGLTMRGSTADCRQEHFRHEGADMLISMECRPWAWYI